MNYVPADLLSLTCVFYLLFLEYLSPALFGKYGIYVGVKAHVAIRFANVASSNHDKRKLLSCGLTLIIFLLTMRVAHAREVFAQVQMTRWREKVRYNLVNL
jgi:hypothetical protein